MWSVFSAQFAKDRRNPLFVLTFIGLSIIATLLFAGGAQSPTSVAIFSEEANADAIETKWERLLNAKESDLRFVRKDGEQAREDVRTGRSDLAIKLLEDDYRLIAASEMPTIQLIEQHVHSVFTEEAHIQNAAGSQSVDEVRKSVQDYMAEPPLRIAKQTLDGEDVPNYNMGIQLLFAFTLFIAMFTIGFKVNGVTTDKVSGIWDRMILSPLSKTNMYLGYLSYTFCIAFFQIMVVLLVFRYGFDYDLGHHLGMVAVICAIYTLSVISLCMLITGFVRKPEQFYAIFPSVIPLIPLISGAYMPPGMMDNIVLRIIADLFPMAHAMDAIMEVVVYDASWQDIALPISLLILIGVFYMGIGINLVERRSR